MFPEFDPAAPRVLEIVGRSVPGEPHGVGVDAVTSALAREDDPLDQELSRDRLRVQRVLEGLRVDGLLEAETAASPKYRLTALGEARLTGTADED